MEITRDDRTNACIFLWKITNISHCWLKKCDRMESPAFIADVLDGTKWSVLLYPNLNEEDLGISLRRKEDCSGPDYIPVTYRLAVMDKDALFLYMTGFLESLSFAKGTHPCCKLFERERIFVTGRGIYLPEDTLTVHCTLWKKKEEELVKSNRVFARTVFKVNRRTFVFKLNEFSTLKPGIRNTYEDDLMAFDLVLNEGLDFEKKLVLNGILIDKSTKYFSFRTSVIDSQGVKEDWGTQEYFADDLKNGVLSTVLFSKKVMENKSRYLPNDVLNLECEYASSRGTPLYELCGPDVLFTKATNVVVEKRNGYHTEKDEPRHSPVLAYDLKSIYSNAIFSDMELRTSTKNFPVHKNILSARSSVFKKMFSKPTKKNNSGHIDITDLDDDTVHRMLLYIYTESFEDIQFEDACKLYAAADKYGVRPLKSRCSFFLGNNLCPLKIFDVLDLSDIHQDGYLKTVALDFILKHDEVFESQEWKQFMATNLELAADIMYQKIIQIRK